MSSFKVNIKNLFGVGPYLLIAGFMLEGLTVIVKRWVSFPINIDSSVQILLMIPCIVACLAGIIWFNRSLNLIGINFSKGENRLITHGPYAYVRHPLYSALMVTLPPLMIISFADLIFFAPWIIIILVSHIIVSIEERGLIDIFGEDYKEYQQCVPALIPYKGFMGKCLRKNNQ